MQDHELIRRIQRGEKQLFGQLAEKYYDDVFRYCYFQTGDEQAAYDCTQETFFHLMRFLDNYRERNKFRAYLIRIALNVCKDYFRKNAGRAGREVAYSEWDAAGPENDPPNAPLSSHGPEQETLLKMTLREGLLRLPHSQREAIVLYYCHGYKLREISRITGVPLSTVKTRIYGGTEKLRQYFKEEEGIHGNKDVQRNIQGGIL